MRDMIKQLSTNDERKHTKRHSGMIASAVSLLCKSNGFASEEASAPLPRYVWD